MKFEVDPLSAIVADRQFQLLFEDAVEDGLHCPPRDFQPDCWEHCRTPQLATDDTCIKCWRQYTMEQALLDLGLIESAGTIEVEQLTDEEIKKADRAGTRYMDEECKRVTTNPKCCTEEDDSFD